MGRQWLQKNKTITANKKAKITTKLVREITIAAKTYPTFKPAKGLKDRVAE